MLNSDFHFLLSDGGSGKGTVIVTAVVNRLVKQHWQIKEILATFHFSKDMLLKVKKWILAEMEMGFRKATNKKAFSRCSPPLSIVLQCHSTLRLLGTRPWGTNFYMLLKKRIVEMHKIYAIPMDIMQDSRKELFDYISDFLEYMGIEGPRITLDFTFSFPVKQTILNEDILVT